MVEHYLGLSLAKEHSAVDWSTRPLPEPWLLYAALDVEVLGELRDAVADDLESQGKAGWAAEEFAHLLDFTGPEPRTDPWRRTSGMHKVRGRRGLAIVRELWQWRDDRARERDVSPGRVLPDAAISEIALTHQRATTAPTRVTVSEPRLSRSVRRHQEAIVEVVAAALALPEDELPVVALPPSGPPPPKAWADRDPVAAARLARLARAAHGRVGRARRAGREPADARPAAPLPLGGPGRARAPTRWRRRCRPSGPGAGRR